jgi:chromosome segregation protein
MDRAGALSAELQAAEQELAVAEAFERELADVAEEAAGARRAIDDEAREVASGRSAVEVKASALLERRNVLLSRRDDIEARLTGSELARADASERRRTHEEGERALDQLAVAVASALEELAGVLGLLGERRRAHVSALAEIRGGLNEARAVRADAERRQESLQESAQKIEVELAELKVRLETALASLEHDLGVEPTVALAAECPPLPEGATARGRARDLENEIRLLGPVNPLALEELAAVEERDRFLSGQIDDVRSTRRDLARVVKAVDEEIVAVFAEAFEDVSSHFEALFSTLFPGGSGRLSLIEPGDMLNSGIEIDARPAGRNVRRLSLLSGGERSLVALAFLFAVFRSRPSPFYLMDEVEAALDDINLHRFLDLVDEFRSEAQLLIVSHQKRTMESADILYGVSMQPGGASKVVTERLRSESAHLPA